MGLLEEAIREHLELQRRSGADPHLVARAEQEALQPLVPGHTPAWAQGPAALDHQQRGPRPERAALEQDTAELDMSTVLGDASAWQDPAPPPEGGVPEFGPVRARRIIPSVQSSAPGEGDFEWELPERNSPPQSQEPPARQGSFAFE